MLSTQELPFLYRIHWQDAAIWMHIYSIWIYLGGEPLIAGMGI